MFASTDTDCRRSESGFALIEVMVALVIVGILLTSIGALIASTVRATHALNDHVVAVEAARTVEMQLPERASLELGRFPGGTAAYRWTVDVLPFFTGGLAPQKPSRWTPQTVVVSVRTQGGTTVQVHTVRLRPRVKP